MRAIAAAVLLLLATGTTATRADEKPADACATPETILTVDATLLRAHDRVQRSGTLPILVVNTAKPGSSRNEASYPVRLERELASRLPGRTVTVSVLNLTGAVAQDMLPAMETAVAERNPALVVWQVGTADAMHNIGLDGFGAALASGIAQTQAHGADIVVMDMQYSPQTSQLLALQPYVDYVEWVTQNNAVFHFPRYEMMRHWIEEGRVTLGSASQEDKLKDFAFVHGCIGRLLAETVVTMMERAEIGQ